MPRVSIEWTIEELLELNHLGQRQVIVTETRDGETTIFGPMSGVVSDAFIRIRRERVAKEMREAGAFNIDDLFPEGEKK